MDNLSAPDESGLPRANDSHSGARPRPWMRYSARLLDIQLFAFPISSCLIFMLPGFFLIPRPFQMALTLPLILVLEACLLATVGSTLGKWLMGSIRTLLAGLSPSG